MSLSTNITANGGTIDDGQGEIDPNGDQSQYYRDLASRVKLVNDTSPWISADPNLMMSLAKSSATTVQLGRNSAAIAGMINMDALHNRLSALDAPTQRAVFNQLTPMQQSALKSSGYSAPQPKQKGLFDELGDALGPVGHAVGDVVGGIGGVVKSVGGLVLNDVNWAATRPAQFYRTVRTLNNNEQMEAYGGAILGGLAAIAGVAAAPFTGGMSLGLTLGFIGGGALLGANALPAITNPTDWWDAFNGAYDGERTFSSESQMAANSLLQSNGSIVNLAKDIAYKGGLAGIAKDFAGVANSTEGNTMLNSVKRVVDDMMQPDDPRYQDTLSQMTTLAKMPEFQQAVATLQNGKISFGRDIARSVGLAPGSDWYNRVSGLSDGIWLVTMDPTLALGALHEARQLARYSVPLLDAFKTASWIDELGQTDRYVGRAQDLLADAVNRKDFGQIRRLLPESQSTWFDLLEHRTEWMAAGNTEYGRDALMDWYYNGAGVESMMSGKSMVKGLPVMKVAHTGVVAEKWGELKDWAKTAIDFADDLNSERIMRGAIKDLDPEAYEANYRLRVSQEGATPAATMSDDGTSQLAYSWDSDPALSDRYQTTTAILRFLDRIPIINQLGTFLATNTTMIPKDGFTLLEGRGAAEQIDKFVDLGRIAGVKSDTRELWRGFIMGQENPALRAEAMRSYMETMMKVGGGDLTEGGQQLISEFAQKSHQVFGYGGADELVVGGRFRKVGIFPVADQSYAMAIPDLKQLRQAVQKGSFMRYMFGAGDWEVADKAVSKIWKPAVLLRLGFVPRAAGEELLAFMAREGVSKYVASFGTRAVAENNLKDPGYALELMKSLKPGMDNLTPEMADLIKSYKASAHVRPIEQMLARNSYTTPMANMLQRYSGFLRDMLERGLLSDEAVAKIPQRFQRALLGESGSLRNLVMTGVDEETKRAASLYQLYFSKPMLEEASATHAGIFDPGTHANGLTQVNQWDPATGRLTSVPMIRNRGVFQFVSNSDPVYYQHAYMSSLQHAIGDPVVAHSLGAVLPRLAPSGITEDAADDLFSHWASLPNGPAKTVALNGLNGKELSADDLDAIMHKLAPSLDAEEWVHVKSVLPHPGSTPQEVLKALIESNVDKEAAFQMLSVLGKVQSYDQDTQGWLQLFLTHRPDVASLDPDASYWLTHSQAEEQLRTYLEAAQIHPSVQDALAGSLHNAITPDGTAVSRTFDQHRMYFPSLHGENAEQLSEAIARRLDPAVLRANNISVEDAVSTAMYESYLRTPSVTMHTPEQVAEAREWIDGFAKRWFSKPGDLQEYVDTARISNPDLVTLTGSHGIKDPRVAQDISATMQRFVGDADVANGSGAAFVTTKRGDQLKFIDDDLAINGRAEQIPIGAQMRDLGHGQVIVGPSVEQSVHEWTPVVHERINQLMKEDSRVALTARRPGELTPDSTTSLWRRVDNGDRVTYVPVKEGEALSPRSDYFTNVDAKKPTPVKWGDVEHMKSEIVGHGDGWLWDQVGPALRDELDHASGQTFFTSDGRRLAHYGIDDVGRATGNLPNQVFAESMSVPPQLTKWDRAVQFGFNKVISPGIDAIARRPMAFHNFMEAYRENSKAYRWLLDGEVFDKAIPTQFGKLFDDLALSSNRQEEIANVVRRNDRYFDHDMTSMSNDEIMGYLGAIDPGELNKVVSRAFSKVQDGGRDYESMRDLLQIKRTNPTVFNNSLDGVDRNVEMARSLIDKFGNHLDTDWQTASHIKDVNAILQANPGMDKVLENGGWVTLQRARKNLASVENRLGEMSVERALTNTVPFLDAHNIKSQFAEYGKAFMPFWYAEENFFKRWGRTLVLHPEAVRKGQLTYMGLKSVGIIRTDGNGKDWFIYPGSQVLASALGKIPGLSVLPLQTAFATQTNQMLPGFSENVGTPSFSPFVTLPMSVADSMFPELAPLQKAIVGKNNVNRGILRQFVPTQFMNAYDAIAADESNTKYASAMMTAMSFLEANGHGLADDATTTQRDDYLRTVRSHARTIMIAQAITGFISPGAASTYVLDKSTNQGQQSDLFRQEWLDLIRYKGIDEGTQEFLDAHSDKASPEYLANPLAYTVGKTKSTSGAPLPATAQAVQFYNDNEDWMKNFPNAGAWLLPPDKDATGKLDLDAYTTQTIDGLRYRLTPAEFLDSMKFKEGATEYFRASDEYKLIVKNANASGNRADRAQADALWATWSDSYKATHPIFAEQLASGDGRTQRQKTISELRIALEDPAAPKAWHFDSVKTMVNTYDDYTAQLAALSQSRSAAAQVNIDALKQRYSDVMEQFVLKYPETESLWTAVLKPESSLT